MSAGGDSVILQPSKRTDERKLKGYQCGIRLVAYKRAERDIGFHRDPVEIALIADACVPAYGWPDWRHCLHTLNA